ncbi:MAG: AraC family transcriptional regulator [Bacteroidetes bacterium]|nr:AraC family transcriptional regulator [Bacteroidota bacterium]
MITKITPHPCLDKIVDYYWIEKNGRSSVKILPDGTTSIIFNLGSSINISDANGYHRGLSDNLIIGTHKKYYLIDEKKDNHLIGIKFKQGGAYHFFKIPMMKFSNKIINLHDVLNGESEKLRGLLVGAISSEEVKKVLDYYLLIKVDMLTGVSDIVDFAIKKVKANGSPSLIKNLCDTANISNKHLITLFNEKIGLSPTLIQRLNKFIKVIETIQNRKKELSWPQVAYECNYYDQAHLINDFKSFSGVSPKTYYDNENANGIRLRLA